MTLIAGTRLGPYEIVAPIGAGGMGEVFRARDTRLDRRVAIKVLPSHLSSDPHLRERFDREARAVSALNHPNICTLYDVGHQDGIDFIVMELLEGETLAERLAKGPMPVEQVLRFGMQIAEGLDKAHRHGIVHRDLKPGNIMITSSGAKLLDFGLAKRSLKATDSDALTEQRNPLTAEGTLLGTFQYMAPEQLEGTEADARSDIFALGAVLHEMATGRRAFQGGSRVGVIGSILKDDPEPPSKIRRELPSAFDQLVRIALEKSPDARWQSAHDMALNLGLIRAGNAADPPLRASHLNRSLVILAIVLLLSTVGAAMLLQRGPAAQQPLVGQFDFSPPTGSTLYPFSGPVAISPNGRMLAYFANTEGRYLLYVRNLDSLESKHIAAAGQGGSFAFWSPDSRSIGFSANGKLKAVDIAAGTARTICEAPLYATGSWNSHGDIIFGGGFQSAIFRVASGGGQPQPATRLDIAGGELSQSWPHFLPDGRRFIYFSRNRDPERSGTYLGSLDSKILTRLMSSDSNAIYASPGYLIFASEGKLVAVPFDAGKGQVAGPRRVIASDVAGFRGSAGSLFSASENGVLAYATPARAKSELQWVNRSGQRLTAIPDTGDCVHVAVSPDDQYVAFESIDPSNGNGTLSTHHRSRGVTSRLTQNTTWSFQPVWSADGREIFYSSFGPGGSGIYRLPRDAAADARLVIPSINVVTWPASQTSDRSQLLLVRTNPTSNTDLWLMPSSVPEAAKRLFDSDADEVQGQFSPDGYWVAYTSNESGRLEVYVRPLTGTARKWKISLSGGSAPRWSRDGKELFFLSSEDRLMSARINRGEVLDTAPQALFEMKARLYFDRYPYDVGGNGTFLVNRLLESSPSRIIVVNNWYAAGGN